MCIYHIHLVIFCLVICENITLVAAIWTIPHILCAKPPHYAVCGCWHWSGISCSSLLYTALCNLCLLARPDAQPCCSVRPVNVRLWSVPVDNNVWVDWLNVTMILSHFLCLPLHIVRPEALCSHTIHACLRASAYVLSTVSIVSAMSLNVLDGFSPNLQHRCILGQEWML